MVLYHTNKPSPVDIHTWISASISYVNMCEKGFKIMNITTSMLPIITTNLTQLLLNSLAISVAIRGGNTPGLNERRFNDELYIRYCMLKVYNFTYIRVLEVYECICYVSRMYD
ncbi:putative invertase/pectin methylesterase inhibitor domain superfamily [Helianthus anomalus]